MKMNLSVVMQTIDKSSAAVKKITRHQSKYSKEITETQKALKNKTGAIAAINSYRKTAKQAGLNNDKLKIAQDRLNKLNAKRKKGAKLTSTETIKLKQQRQKIKELTSTQKQYGTELHKQQRQLKSTGVNVKRLRSEESRLNKEYGKTSQKLSKLTTRYARLKKASNWVKKRGQIKMPSAGQAKAGALGVMGILGSAAGFFGIINRTASSMDKLTKSAQKLNLPVQQLQAYESQAKHAGMENGAFAEGLLELQKRLGKLKATGKGSLAMFLKQSKNPLLLQLKNAQNTDDAYKTFIKTYSKMKDASKQAALADAAFGGKSKKMLLILAQGQKGMIAARKEYMALGGGATEQDTKKAEAYNDELQKIQEVFSTIKMQVGAEIMGEMTKEFKAFIKQFKQADKRLEMLKQAKETVKDIYIGFKNMGKGIMFVLKYMPELIAGFLAFKSVMLIVNGLMMANPIGAIVGAIALLVTALTYLNQKYGILEKIKDYFKKDKEKRLNSKLPKVAKLAIRNKQLKKNAPITNPFFKGTKDRLELMERVRNNNRTKESVIKSPTIQSKAEVTLKIDSALPTAIVEVKTDDNTDISINTGNTMDLAY